ncbi:hypothetical protein BC629DRAFT_1053260 [Irpex lacteus]|nr:hypothetical protein BC629DRAFT_1053260 [Irpex lacteus]
MVAETRSKARKESKVKPQPSTTTRNQRSLRDMFASSSKPKGNDSAIIPQETAIEVPDSSSEAEIPPLTPETVQATKGSDVEIVASVTEINPQTGFTTSRAEETLLHLRATQSS